MSGNDRSLMELMITMTQVSRAYKAVCDRLASRFGLTQAIAWPIVAISRLGDGVRPGVIAEAVGIEPSSVVRLVDQLVAAGLIERREESRIIDRRGCGLRLPALLLAFGIGVQNFPEGMCVAFPLRQKGLSPVRSFLFSQGSGAVEIPACVLGAVAAAAIAGLMPWALAFSAGAMIAVVCSELIPECFSGNKTVASAGVVLGFCLMMILDVAFG